MSHSWTSLVFKGAITEQAAQRISQWTLRNYERLGMIAIDHGLIIGRQIDEILDHQRRSDLKFGEIAVELGFLTQDKVDILLQIQHYRMLTGITEAVHLSSLLSLADGIRMLSDFVREQPGECFTRCENARTVY